MEIGRDRKIDMYEKMLTIRHFEEAIFYVYTHGWMPGLAHLSCQAPGSSFRGKFRGY